MASPPRSHSTDIEKRRDDALRRALQTPPKPKQESVKLKERKPRKEPNKDQG